MTHDEVSTDEIAVGGIRVLLMCPWCKGRAALGYGISK